MAQRKTNPDEVYIVELANSMPGLTARLSTPEEDCGYHKADVVISIGEKDHYVQVSHTPKSRGEVARLAKRGTQPISTHRYAGHRIPREALIEKLSEIVGN